MDRTIFLLDMNAYFASVEQVSNPALRGKPIVVCGEGRTVVTTASYEARKFGVKTGMNLYEARKVCPQVIPVCGNMDKYVDTSLRIHRILLAFTDQVEAFSIDECFMDVTYLCRKEGTPEGVAREVKRRIKEELGLLCSIGVGPNKMIAKLGSKMQKPDGLTIIRTEDIPRVFADLPLKKMQGIGMGPKLQAKLKMIGIHTARQLGETPLDLLTTQFGPVLGHFLKDMGAGIDYSRVRTYDEHDEAKSVGHSYTFPKDTWDMQVVHSYIRILSEKVGARLRKQELMGRTVHFYVRFADFTGLGRQRSLKYYIIDGKDIYDTALNILGEFLPLPKAVRLVGVTLGNLLPYDRQGFLFEQMEQRQQLISAVDAINQKYGSLTIKPTSVLIAERFGMSPGCGMVPKERLRG